MATTLEMGKLLWNDQLTKYWNPLGNSESIEEESPKYENVKEVYVIGVDAKIGKDGLVYEIEENGIDSGTSGFSDLGIPVEEKLRENLKKSLGEDILSYTGSKLRGNGIDNAYNRFSGSNLTSGEWQKLDEEYGDSADSIIGYEEILDDKLRIDEVFNNGFLRGFKPKTYQCSVEEAQTLLEENPETRYIVKKPKNGSLGNSIEFIEASKWHEEIDNDENYVLEPFVESKGILSEKTGELHDGCMRYMIILKEMDNGRIDIEHLGGYWRLCPKPISEYGNKDAMRANYSNGAIPQRASAEDLELVGGTIEQYMRSVYSGRKEIMKVEKEIERFAEEIEEGLTDSLLN